MANVVKFRRSNVSGKIPLLTDIQLGELAINTFDGKLFTHKDNGTGSIVEIGAIPDGDKGDITVSGGGLIWTIDAGSVTGGKIASNTITNDNISSSAAIADTKLATISTANKISLSALDIDGATDIGAALSDTDLFAIDDGANGTNRKATVSRISDYTFNKISGDITVSSAGAATLSSTGVSAGTYTKLTVDIKGRITSGTTLSASDIPTITSSKISDFDTQVRTSRLDQMAAPTSSVSLNNQKITSLATPTSDSDAATKAYVDAVKQGLDIKDSVRVATTVNITLSGLQSIDGVTVSSGNRVLVKNQDTASQNGIYVASASTWSRASDADSSAKVTTGLFVFVSEGTTNSDSGWVLTTNDTITLDSTSLSFTQFSGAGQITAGDGLTKTANTLNVATADSGRIVVNADSIDLATTGISAGTYRSVSVDTYGRVTSGSNPTTLSGYGITDAQPLDADLTAIAGLAGTSGFLKKTAADTWALDTNTYLTGNQNISITGDATGSGTTSISLTLANSGVTQGTYNNSSTTVTPFTVDSKGRITSTGAAVTIAPAFSSITSKPTTLSGYGITDAASSTHTHGNITNAGAIGSTANLPIITTTSGVLTTGSFGTTANTFCQGNDSRLSDTRNTTNSITFNNGGSGATSGSTFNGSSAVTISYNTVGAPKADGTGATGTWGVSIDGSSGTFDYLLPGLAGQTFFWDGASASYYWTKIANVGGSDGHVAILISAKTDVNYVPYTTAILSLSKFNSSTVSVKFDSLASFDINLFVRIDNNNDVWLKADAIWNSYKRWRVIDAHGSYTVYTSSLVETLTTPANSVQLEVGQAVRGAQGAMGSAVVGNAPPHIFGSIFSRGTIEGSNITSTGNVTGSSTSCTGNAATATTATNLSGGSVSATTGSFSGTVDFTGGSGAVPALRVRSGGANWSEGLAVHPSADNGYALTFFRTRSSLTDNTNTWAIGNLGDGGTNNFGLLRSGLTGGSGIRVDSIFDVTQAGVLRFGFNPTVGANRIFHAGNYSASNAWTPVYTSSITVSTSSAGTFTKTGGSLGWNAHVYSSEGYTTNVYTSCSASQVNGDIMFGLNSDPDISNNYDNIDYAWYFVGNGSLQIYENGAYVSSVTGLTYLTTDTLSIVYDGICIMYLKNNRLIRTVSRAANTSKLYFDSSFYTVGASINNVSYGVLPNSINTKPSNDQFQVDINSPLASTGTWIVENSSSAWGNPKFDTLFDKFRYADPAATVTYTIPAGMKSAWVSHLCWDTGGYVDVYGVESNGNEVFLRRFNTRQAVENTGGTNHDGSTVTFAASGLDDYIYLKFSVKVGRFHMTGLSFSTADNEGTEGVGLVHPGQISHQGAGSGLAADTAASCTGNAATATTFSTDRTNYLGVTNAAVAGQLMWKNYGNNHTLFDASAGTSPQNTAIDRFTPTYPVDSATGINTWGYSINLMGWNGTSTYGVRVDYARAATSAINSNGVSGTGTIVTSGKSHYLGESTNWDSTGFSNLTNLHFQGHNQFWIGAGNAYWYRGGVGTEHDLLITTMPGYDSSSYFRGITFAADINGAGNNGYRLGRWQTYSGTDYKSSRLQVDASLCVGYGARGTRTYDTSTYPVNAGVWQHGRDNAGYGTDTIRDHIFSPTANGGGCWGSFASLEVSSPNDGSGAIPALFRMHQWGSGAVDFWKPNGTDLYIRETPGGGGTWFTRLYLDKAKLLVFNNSGVTGASAPSYTQNNIELYTSDNNVPCIGFHRAGYSATALYEYDGQLWVNAWTTRSQTGLLLSSGNYSGYSAFSGAITGSSLTTTGNITAYSDEKLKKDWTELDDNFIEKISMIKSGTFTRTDTGERQVGVSAQELQEVLPEAVVENTDGILSVAYGNAALSACVILSRKLIELSEEIKELKAAIRGC